MAFSCYLLSFSMFGSIFSNTQDEKVTTIDLLDPKTPKSH